MSFTSPLFFIFFPVVAGLHFAVPHRWRWFLLLIASYVFYMSWHPGYALLILFSTVVDYVAGLAMGAKTERSDRRKYLLMSLVANLGLLFIFKYYNFFLGVFEPFINMAGLKESLLMSHFLLPVGISFYTFQTLSYTIDVYRGDRSPERHFGIFALYVSFFPQLVAGPIERSTRLLPQFFEKKSFDAERVADGLKLMLWGMFKKVVIADRLAVLVDTIYSTPGEFTGIPLIVATIFFAFQIYCDFSGYSDIAIGAAQVMGFSLMDNFRRPNAATSIQDFWRRWHISLSQWFRDYLYIPLGGNRLSMVRQSINLMVVFLLSGLWHGAGWTFIIWGGIHGLYLTCSLWTRSLRKKVAEATRLSGAPWLLRIWQTGITFILVCFAWIFFRAASLPDAMYIVRHLFAGIPAQLADLNGTFWTLTHVGLPPTEFLVAIFMIVFLELVHIIQAHKGIRHMLVGRPLWLRWSIYYVMIFSIFFLGQYGQEAFIYFQF